MYSYFCHRKDVVCVCVCVYSYFCHEEDLGCVCTVILVMGKI